MFSTCLIFCLYPLYVYWRFKEKEFVLGFFIPYVDRFSTWGYRIQIFSQIIQTMNASALFCFTDLTFFYFLFFAGAYEEIVEHECLALSEAIVECGKTHEYPTAEMQQKFHVLLINVIKTNQKMDL